MTITQEQIERLKRLFPESKKTFPYTMIVRTDDLRAAVETLEKLPTNADGNKVVFGDIQYFDSSKRYKQFHDTPPIHPVDVDVLFVSDLHGCIHVKWKELHSSYKTAEAAAKENEHD